MRPGLFISCMLALSVPASAQDLRSIQAQGYVSDFSSVLNAGHRAELERYLARLDALTGVEVAIVTVPSLGGAPIEDAANDLYRRWGIDKKGKDEGALLLLATRDRRMRLEVGYGLGPILPDGYDGTLLRSMRPFLRAREYGPALLEAANQIGTKVAGQKNVSLDATIPSRREVNESAVPYLVILIPIGFVVLLVWIFRRSRRRFASHAWANPVFIPTTSFDWGSHSGGGFGGYDSNDTFGGFGGGDSGGGGASSDW